MGGFLDQRKPVPLVCQGSLAGPYLSGRRHRAEVRRVERDHGVQVSLSDGFGEPGVLGVDRLPDGMRFVAHNLFVTLRI